jgi:hypothetical protein
MDFLSFTITILNNEGIPELGGILISEYSRYFLFLITYNFIDYNTENKAHQIEEEAEMIVVKDTVDFYWDPV